MRDVKRPQTAAGEPAAAAPALENALEAVPLAGFTVPWGRQEIALEELRFRAGGMPLLRIRIREARRFTIFDIDATTARNWGAAMADWGAHAAVEAAPKRSEDTHDA